MRSWLDRVATSVQRASSSVWAALTAVLLAGAWLAVAFSTDLVSSWEFPRAWESVLLVVTALVTFVMVFFLQSAQERHTRAIQLKLDELLRAVEGARDHHLVGLEQKGSDDMDRAEEKLIAEPRPAPVRTDGRSE